VVEGGGLDGGLTAARSWGARRAELQVIECGDVAYGGSINLREK
jgi:hypothetical protein